MRRLHALARDPRHYQVAILTALLVYGRVSGNLVVPLARVALLVGATLLTQLGFTRLKHLPKFDPRSPLISGLSLALLLRTGDWWLAALAGFVTIAGKFVIRYRGKHVFNPTNLALVAMMLATDRVWVSPGLWGHTAVLGFALAGLGMLVVYRAARPGVPLTFLCTYVAILFGRALWLGDPMTIPAHELASGTLLIFTFLMISDPKTVPDHRWGRLMWAALVAGVAGFIRFELFHPSDVIWALAVCAPLVPLLDRLLPHARCQWPGHSGDDHGTPPRRPAHPWARPRPLAPGLGLLRVLRLAGEHEALQPLVEGGPRPRR